MKQIILITIAAFILSGCAGMGPIDTGLAAWDVYELIIFLP